MHKIVLVQLKVVFWIVWVVYGQVCLDPSASHVGCPDMKRTKGRTASKVRLKVTYAVVDDMLTPCW
ncbi:Uncharacterized protein APZ42_006523 [Daphnia magna]|uniref:Secreted protein n=1 Tax=Daphnia magna TaxID=35525 RepID=A0A164FUU5_9CRUS|nr:Uncharacterized protein APZ42_006523 [Daphnia magna]